MQRASETSPASCDHLRVGADLAKAFIYSLAITIISSINNKSRDLILILILALALALALALGTVYQ
jgi:hypothetical protein